MFGRLQRFNPRTSCRDYRSTEGSLFGMHFEIGSKNVFQNVRVGSSSYQRRNQSNPDASFTVARYRSASLS